MNKDQVLNWIFWFWVGAAILAYGHQFRGFILPILQLVGLS